MKFKIDISTFKKEIEIAVKSASNKTSLDICSNIRFFASDNKVTLSTKNYQSSFVSTFDAEVTEVGDFLVNCSKLTEITKKLSSGNYIFTEDNGKLKIQPEGNKKMLVNMRTLNPYQFPTIDTLPSSLSYSTVNSATLLDSTGRCADCVSFDKIGREFLKGINISKPENDNQITFCATNGKNLARVIRSFNGFNNKAFNIIITPAFFSLVKDIVESNETVDVAFSKTMAYARVNGREITSIAYNGQFPEFNRVIKTNNPKKALANKKEFEDAFNLSSTLIDDTSKRIAIFFKANEITISSDSTNFGTASQAVNAEYVGTDTPFMLNAVILNTIIHHIDSSEKICFEFTDSNTPITIHPDSATYDYLYVIMPMMGH